MIGRYVIYFNERLIIYPTDYSRFAFTDLCEVEVYGKLLSNMNYKHKLFHYFILNCYFIIILYIIKLNLKVVLYSSMVMPTQSARFHVLLCAKNVSFSFKYLNFIGYFRTFRIWCANNTKATEHLHPTAKYSCQCS